VTDWTFERFATLVDEMRAAQRSFYRLRRKATGAEHHRLLTEALRLEVKVDHAIEEIGRAARDSLPLFDGGGGGG
jgi:hypothetical protein